MISEYEAPTRAEIKKELQAVANMPANKGLKVAALRLKQRERLDTFLQGRGLGVREIRALASDVDSYFPENYTAVGRQV